MKFEASIGKKYRQKYSYLSPPRMDETMDGSGRNTGREPERKETSKAKSGTIVDPRMRRMRGLTALYFMTTIALAHFNIQRIAIFLKAHEAKENALRRGPKLTRKKKIVRARDRHRKSGYFRADSYRMNDVDVSYEPPPPMRT